MLLSYVHERFICTGLVGGVGVTKLVSTLLKKDDVVEITVTTKHAIGFGMIYVVLEPLG